MTNNLQSILKDLLNQHENIILNQLHSLIKEGLLVVKLGEPIVVQREDSATLELRRPVEILSKEHELIAKLKDENQDLKFRLEIIKDALGNKS